MSLRAESIVRSSLRWIVFALASVISSWTQATYVYTNIDYPAAVATDIRGLNNSGQLVGFTSPDGATDIGLLYKSGTYMPLPPVPGTVQSDAHGINDTGTITGAGAIVVGNNYVASVGTVFDGSTYATFSHAGYDFTEGRAIGNSGLVTGFAYTGGSNVAFIYDPSTGIFTDILTGGPSTLAQGINTAGQVVGSATTAMGLQGFLREPDGTLSYFQINGNATAARGINDNGLITGFFSDPSGLVLSFVGNSGGYQILQIPGAQQTVAEGINNAGQVVGVWIDAVGNRHGFIATPATLPTGTTVGGAYTFSTAVVANTPIFIDPVVAIGYDFATSATDPNFATVTLPIGIGDSKYTVAANGITFPVAGGDVLDFRTMFPAGVTNFGVRDIEMTANLDPANPQAFAPAVSFVASGMFTGTMTPLTATVFVVTNNNDSGSGSLRDAIAQSNADPGPNMVTFDPSVTGTITLTSGSLQITGGPLAVVGPGADTLAIDGNANSRIFTIYEAGAPACPSLSAPIDFLVSISGLTLQNGRQNTDNSGGAILSAHSLALDSVVLKNNTSPRGGAVSFSAQYAGQALTIANSQFLGNVAKPTAAGTVHNDAGGALLIADNCSGTQTVTATTISNSVFSGNSAQPASLSGYGGAVGSFTRGSVAITDTRIVNNSVIAPNPPVANQVYRGGGIYVSIANSFSIVRSEISGNSNVEVTNASLTRGGAIGAINNVSTLQGVADVTALSIVNSTISGNTDTAFGGALWMFGNVAAVIDNSTIVNNTAAAASTGGIRVTTGATSPSTGSNATTPTLAIVSSIVANNSADDIATNLPTIPTFTLNMSNSLVGSICPSPSCVITVAGTGNLTGVNPKIAPLAFNGGPTQTHALLFGSPAIDAGSNPLNLTTDQRGPGGVPRVVGVAADMGAFEYVPGLAPVLQGTASRKTHGSVGALDLTLH